MYIPNVPSRVPYKSVAIFQCFVCEMSPHILHDNRVLHPFEHQRGIFRAQFAQVDHCTVPSATSFKKVS